MHLPIMIATQAMGDTTGLLCRKKLERRWNHNKQEGWWSSCFWKEGSSSAASMTMVLLILSLLLTIQTTSGLTATSGITKHPPSYRHLKSRSILSQNNHARSTATSTTTRLYAASDSGNKRSASTSTSSDNASDAALSFTNALERSPSSSLSRSSSSLSTSSSPASSPSWFFPANSTDQVNGGEDADVDVDVLVSVDIVLKWTPILIPILAYLTYDPLAVVFSTTIEAISFGENSWVAVDGGAYQAKIITPAINGIVVQAIAILFAVLSGNTISTLRQRQQDICFAILQETTHIRILATTMMLFQDNDSDEIDFDRDQEEEEYEQKDPLHTYVYYRKYQDRCRRYLVQYIDRLIAEGHSFSRSYETYSMDVPELQSIIRTLNRMEKMASSLSNVDDGKCRSNNINDYLPPCYNSDLARDSIRLLWQYRSERLTSLMSTFPMLHYVIISTLAISMCGAFLMETDQDILVFLNAIQLRLLWTSLVGTFCALGVVLYDLNHPFRGSYQVSVHAVDELIPVRKELIRYSPPHNKDVQGQPPVFK